MKNKTRSRIWKEIYFEISGKMTQAYVWQPSQQTFFAFSCWEHQKKHLDRITHTNYSIRLNYLEELH